MLPALQTSLAGLLSAGNRARLAADNIVTATTAGANSIEAASAVSAGRAYGSAVIVGSNMAPHGNPPAYGPSTLQSPEGRDDVPGLTRSIVDLTLAAQAYKANAAALRTADETLGRFLEDLS